nr:sugar transferase [uncultured Carboxylicivirga sp.]
MASGGASKYKNSTKRIENRYRWSSLHDLIKSHGEEVYSFITENASLTQEKVLVRKLNQPTSILSESGLNVLVDFNSLSFEYGQSYLYQLNYLLKDGGILFCNVDQSSKKLIEFKPSKSKSKAEVMGRLVNAGFSIIDFRNINGSLHLCVMKIDLPKSEPGGSDRLIIPMTRIGKDGKELKVFKIRTMYPYSEYLQEYVVGMNGYNDKGKPKNDFRLTKLGRFVRKYWIDELPQLYNLIKGELAIVGVRPLSKARFMELPDDVRTMRVTYKPGCVPPYVALNMPDSQGNIEAERIYFKEKEKYPHWIDIKYFFMALFNVLSGRIHSS